MPPQGVTSSNGSNGMLSSPPSSFRTAYSDHAATKMMVATTEGWLELFLTTAEKYNFSIWSEEVQDKSLTHMLLNPVFDFLSKKFLPDTLAPNVITLAGLLSLGQAWYILHLYGEDYAVACTWFAVIHILVFFCTNSLDSLHAVRVRQQSAVSRLFKYSCDSCTTVFGAILLAYCLGAGRMVETQWYAVQIAQLVLYLKHLSAFHRGSGMRYRALAGPGEVILASVTLLIVRATFGLDWLVKVYESTLHLFIVRHMPPEHDKKMLYQENSTELAQDLVMYAYYATYVMAVIKTLLLKKSHAWSRFGLLASLTMRLIPAILFHVGLLSGEEGGDGRSYGVADVICDGLFLAVLTSDITLAKMAGRELHPWIILMSTAAIGSTPVILTLVFTYYIAVFTDLCAYLNMPLLTTCRNVYCDGVYDLCHIGHKRLFQKALQHGNRLFVGVVGDEDAQAYKRPPIMTHAERCAEVEACKAVTKVIQNAPCFGLTQEFLDHHQIHIVCYGEEYLERYPDPKDDPYYSLPRQQGIARPLPRTNGLSTTDLIRRIQKSAPADEKKSTT